MFYSEHSKLFLSQYHLVKTAVNLESFGNFGRFERKSLCKHKPVRHACFFVILISVWFICLFYGVLKIFHDGIMVGGNHVVPWGNPQQSPGCWKPYHIRPVCVSLKRRSECNPLQSWRGVSFIFSLTTSPCQSTCLPLSLTAQSYVFYIATTWIYIQTKDKLYYSDRSTVVILHCIAIHVNRM